MKKILLSLIFFVSFVSNAQFFEGFENGVPGSMTQTLIVGTTNWTGCAGNTGDAPCPITGSGSASFYLGNSVAEITSLSTPVMDLSSGSYRLKFKHLQRVRGANKNRLFVELSVDGGTTWSTLVFYANDIQNITQESIDLNPAIVTSNTMIRFRAQNKFGYAIILDDISVSPIVNDDAEMNSVVLNSIILQGSTSITGSIKNTGSNVLDAVNCNWQVDSGTIYTQSLSGLNLAPNQSYTYIHPDNWSATPGIHSLKVWVSNSNNTTDTDPSNNELIKNPSVASNLTTRIPLYEKFSSSTCPPCATFNTNHFSPFYTASSSNLVLLDYQVNWPGAGDPYYTAEVGVRRAYYLVNSAPTLFVDAKEGTDFSTSVLQTNFNSAVTKPAYFSIEATSELIGEEMSVNITTTPFVSGTYRLYAAVVEKVTTGNIATNGETQFKNVLMKMLPNASGTLIDFTYDTPVNTLLQASLNGTNVEEFSDLEVVVFIQNIQDKTIMQSRYATTALANSQFSSDAKIKLFPNPSDGILSLNSKNPVNIVVTDLTGKIVFSINQVTNETKLDLSSLQKGIYLAKISDELSLQTQKIIIK